MDKNSEQCRTTELIKISQKNWLRINKILTEGTDISFIPMDKQT